MVVTNTAMMVIMIAMKVTIFVRWWWLYEEEDVKHDYDDVDIIKCLWW